MADIPFNKTMTIDKRNPKGAYLIQNRFDSFQEGLYPAAEFTEVDDLSAGGFEIVGREDSFIFTSDGTDTKVYTYNGAGSPTFKYTISGVEYTDSVEGNNGVHMIGDRGEYYEINSSSASLIDDLGGSDSQAKITFDGQFYFIVFDEKIYRGLTDAVPTEVFANTGGNAEFITPYNGDIAYIVRDGLDVIFNLWGKDSSTVLDKQFVITNLRPLGFGVVNGRLLLVSSKGQTENTKEQKGRLTVDFYNGEHFDYLNSIKAGDEQLSSGAQALGDDFLLVAVASNNDDHNPILYKDWIMKVKANGAIEVLSTPETENGSDVQAIKVHYDYITVGFENGKLYENSDNSGNDDYDNYDDFNETHFITNFIPAKTKKDREKLENVGFMFEKIFNDEEMDLYIRFSERDVFTKIGTINADIVKNNTELRMSQEEKDTEASDNDLGLTPQTYEFTESDISGEDSLPFDTFNEIQFYVHLKEGFSIVKGWYNE